MPNEAQLRHIWTENIRSNQGICGNAIRICEFHFMRSEVQKSGLLRGAVPSIFNYANREEIMTVPIANFDDKNSILINNLLVVLLNITYIVEIFGLNSLIIL